MEVATQNDYNHESLLDESNSDNADIANNYKKDNAEESPARREICEWQHINPDTGIVMKGRLEADRWVDGSLKSYGKESSSGISNLMNTKSNTSNALIKSTHCTMCPQNVSLEAIEEGNRKKKFSKSSVPSSLSATVASTRTKTSTTEISAAPTQSRQLICRLYKQPSFYGNSNSSVETCVGVHNCDADIDVSANGAVRVAKASPVAMPREQHQHYTVNLKEQQQKFQKRNEVTPTQLNRQSRQNLESFRHYDDYDNMSPARSSNDDNLRIIQERQTYVDNGHKRLQRSHSISNDDLNAECNKMNHGDENLNEWQRVSRLRRSFQSASSGCYTHSTMQTVKRPTDLPMNSISVSEICANLENGQRLNTAVRNNNADLLALNTILNEPKDMKSNTVKMEAVLTAKSLNEIRNNLKRLSNEALYKDDFITSKELPSEKEQIKVPEQKLSDDDFFQRTQKSCISRANSSDLTPFYNEESNEKLVEEFNYDRLQKITFPHTNLYTTNSLEPRRKTKENASVEWHLRRKSYGFEKMSTVADNSMSGIDYSTDSGLGHSSEISNCASIETAKPRRGMVIHFGDSLKLNNSQNKIKNHCTLDQDINKLQKRHSIAVDKYLGENLTKSSQIQMDEMGKAPALYSKSSINVDKNYKNVYKGVFQRSAQQKRVEFCKTEVHFGAESGRVNIVETDGKPPPTSNFRRRRRTVNGPLQSLVHSPSSNDYNVNCNEHINNSITTSLTRFGNETTNSTQIFDEPDLMKKANVTVSVSQLDLIDNPSKCYTSTNGDDTTDLDNEELSSIRGILKNKLKKPKPYHLGENIKHTDVLWGVQKNEETADEIYEFKNIQKHKTDFNLKNISGSKVHSTKINLSTNDTFKGFTTADLIDSNVMSIKLHSPQDYLCKTETMPLTHLHSFSEKPQRNSCSSLGEDIRIIKPVPEQLKIIKETRGARKLRQHELSYFGVPIEENVPVQGISDMKTKSTYSTSPSRKQKTFFFSQENDFNKNDSTNNGHSINNKPDLLRHGKSEKLFSKNCSEEKYSSNRRILPQPRHFDNTNIINYDEHFYENISNELTPIFKIKSDNTTEYDRKTDISRDENILKEMKHDADQNLKSLPDEDQIEKRYSSHRRNLQPLQTISEKMVTKIIHDKCIAVKMPSHKTSIGEKVTVDNSKKLLNFSVNRSRTSSLSSVESSARSRSRSLSSDHEYENINLKSKKNIKVKKQNISSPNYSQPLSLTTHDKSNEKDMKGVCSKSNNKKSMKISKDHNLESEQHSKIRSKNKIIPKSSRLISYNSGSKKTECSTLDNTKGSHQKSYEQYQKHFKKNQSDSSKYIDGKNSNLSCKHKSNQCFTLTSHINLTDIKLDRHKQSPDSSSDKVITHDSFNKAEKEKLFSLNLKDQTSRLNQHHSNASAMSNKTRERKNAIPITSLQSTKCNEKKLHEKLPTYSKNVEQIGSGQQFHPKTIRSKPSHIQHNLTTATIVGKIRDRHRKEK